MSATNQIKIPLHETELLEQWLDSLWLEKGLSENSLSNYRRDLMQFMAWLAAQPLTTAEVERTYL